MRLPPGSHRLSLSVSCLSTDDQQCYWPYCDQNGQCSGNIFVGQPYTQAGNWQDGSQGVRPWDYTIQGPNGPVTYPGNALCTVGMTTDVGNTEYPNCARRSRSLSGFGGYLARKGNREPLVSDFVTRAGNPQCVMPRCLSTGKCGVDTVNDGQPCTPIDGRASGGYNEVFVGAPNW